ncbi:uncharacterized protein LOC129616259 isoform X2 [Condylostylus longicornis]|uniref:uncharacterized protein LOC129616259 isoform X2 n=1 Tax=Condylostylus longicornis TaxID=2530218 RepID=UPI00244E0A0C|nr:uncharacterized protein LOC129616259 isoform X2 [Condylostylus longicornis]
MTENKVIKNIVNSALSTCEKNRMETNLIIKKVETKIAEKSEDNGLLKQKTKGKTSIKHVNSNIGGRLQFFKDGKFIFELARSSKGEKSGWVPVAKNLLGNTHVQYKSYGNCLSQSFIWQRNQKWKQQNPQKYNHSNLEIFFKRTENFMLSADGERLSLKKRRQPLNEIICDKPFKSSYQCKEIQNSITGTKLKRKSLSRVIQGLLKKAIPENNESPGQNISNHLYNSKIKEFQNRHHISPRKRILRELEKVSLEDVSKRSRAKEIISFQIDTVVNECIQSHSFQKSERNGFYQQNESNGQNFRNSSILHSNYSINSLLGNVSIKPIELTCSALKKNKKNLVREENSANDNHLEEMDSEKFNRIVSKTRSNKEDLDITTKSPLNYSKYFNMDNITTNFQTDMSKQNFYRPFSSIFCQGQPPPNIYANGLQSTFDSRSSLENSEHKTNRIKKYSNLIKEVEETHKTSAQAISSAQKFDTISAPAMLRKYSQNESIGISAPLYVPHMSYYHPYATAAMRHQLWTHYNKEVVPNPIERLSPSIFCLNGISSYSSLDSVPVLQSKQCEERMSPIKSSNLSDVPISLCVKDIKQECSTDAPLNLSKH